MKTLLCSAVLIACALTVSADLTLVQQGQSSYRIVVAARAIPSERYAAEELQRYLERISGAQLPIVDDSEPAGEREILLGDNTHAAQLSARPDLNPLGPDGFITRVDGARLIIAGGKPRGTLNGVYTLLEEQLQVRWFTPELEVVPKRATISLPALDQKHVPVLENRDVFWREMMRDADFAARHRLNGQHYSLQERHGGAFATYYPFVHSFDLLIPKELFGEHPEYFPLIKGQRKNGYVQRCLSNLEVLKLAIANVRQWIQSHPEASIISVSQNDTINNCECPDCKAIDDAEGSPAGSLLKFVNAVAESVEKDFPKVRIDTLAYQYTRKPPKTIRPRANVIIRLCSIECCFAHSLEACASEANRRFREDIIAWQPVAPLLYVWDYTPNFGHYQQPFPNFGAIQDNVRFFTRHGVRSLFEQGNYSAGGQGELGPLRAYLLAKLLWNPDTDLARHETEFLHAFYGKAAAPMKQYLDLLQTQVRTPDCHAHIFDRPTVCYLNPDFLESGDHILRDAEAADPDASVRFRVQVARLPIWYVKLATNRVSDRDRVELLDRFLDIARKAGISNISEGTTLEDWAKKMLKP